jgi:branched-chain amino acid transport system ATP-binding protein
MSDAATGGEGTGGVREADDVVLSTKGLTKNFGELTVVDGVDLSVPEGELRAIIGPNGAGKTTLFNLITGTLSPSAGTVRTFGEDITDDPPEARVHRGMVRSYQSNQLFTDSTVLENVRIAAQTAEIGGFRLKLLTRGDDIARDRAREVLDTFGLDEKADTKAKNLPHGFQRKLGIAIAVATDPDLLMLDEPTSGMGPEATQETAALIEDIRNDLELTLVLIEHDMDVVLNISDRVSVLHRGALIATGTAEEIHDDEAVQRAYLGGLEEE